MTRAESATFFSEMMGLPAPRRFGPVPRRAGRARRDVRLRPGRRRRGGAPAALRLPRHRGRLRPDLRPHPRARASSTTRSRTSGGRTRSTTTTAVAACTGAIPAGTSSRSSPSPTAAGRTARRTSRRESANRDRRVTRMRVGFVGPPTERTGHNGHGQSATTQHGAEEHRLRDLRRHPVDPVDPEPRPALRDQRRRPRRRAVGHERAAQRHLPRRLHLPPVHRRVEVSLLLPQLRLGRPARQPARRAAQDPAHLPALCESSGSCASTAPGTSPAA